MGLAERSISASTSAKFIRQKLTANQKIYLVNMTNYVQEKPLKVYYWEKIYKIWLLILNITPTIVISNSKYNTKCGRSYLLQFEENFPTKQKKLV